LEQLANNASSPLNSGITSGATSLVVTSAAAFPTSGNFRLVVDSEIMLATAVSGTTFTVSRAQEGTTAAAHGTGAAVTHILTAGGLQQSVNDYGAMALVEQHTASSSTELDFTSWYSSTFDEYIIELLNVIPATNAVSLLLQYSTNGGSTYDNSAIYAWTSNYSSTSATGGNIGTSAQTSLALHLDTSASVSSTTSRGGVCGQHRLYSPGSTTFYKRTVGGVTFYNNPAALDVQVHGGTVYASVTAVNAFRVFFSSGNITSGIVRVYGIKH